MSKKPDLLTTHRKMAVAFECMQNAQNVMDRCPESVSRNFDFDHVVNIRYGTYRVKLAHGEDIKTLRFDLFLLADVDKERRVKTVTTRVKETMREMLGDG